MFLLFFTLAVVTISLSRARQAGALSFTQDMLFRCFTVSEFSNSLSQSVNCACEAINTRRLFYYMKSAA